MLLRAAARHPDAYRDWIERAEARISESQLGQGGGETAPALAILVLGTPASTEADYRESAASVRQAFGDGPTIYTFPAAAEGCQSLADAKSLSAALEGLAGSGVTWLLPLLAGDLVSPRLGRAVAVTVDRAASSAVIYWDEDQLGRNGRCRPWIKPDWDRLLFLARDYLSGSALFRIEAARDAAGGLAGEPLGPATIAKLALRIAGRSYCKIHHLPLILTHRRLPGGFVTAAKRCELLVDDRQQFDCGPETVAGFVEISPLPPPQWPKVSIIIPTRDRGALLEACTNSLRLLRYPGEVELIIVDNGTTEARAVALLGRLAAEGSARILEIDGPFNFSAFNNRAAHAASGQMLCLLNNDVEAMDGVWLEKMVRHASVDGVGAVGAQLLYPDRRIQHAGVAIGIGGAAGHVEKGRPENDHQFVGWHGVTREVSAVTAACLMVDKQLYLDLGGLDEVQFPVAFNDVDLCLRLKSRGYRNVMVAEAQLTHHESVSRGDDLAKRNVERFKRELGNLHGKWGTEAHLDPHFSPLFARISERCLLAY